MSLWPWLSTFPAYIRLLWCVCLWSSLSARFTNSKHKLICEDNHRPHTSSAHRTHSTKIGKKVCPPSPLFLWVSTEKFYEVRVHPRRLNNMLCTWAPERSNSLSLSPRYRLPNSIFTTARLPFRIPNVHIRLELYMLYLPPGLSLWCTGSSHINFMILTESKEDHNCSTITSETGNPLHKLE